MISDRKGVLAGSLPPPNCVDIDARVCVQTPQPNDGVPHLFTITGGVFPPGSTVDVVITHTADNLKWARQVKADSQGAFSLLATLDSTFDGACVLYANFSSFDPVIWPSGFAESITVGPL